MAPDDYPITQESDDDPTPAGGVRSTIYYMDDDGNPTDKREATRAEGCFPAVPRCCHHHAFRLSVAEPSGGLASHTPA
jgi:hypothetical protein